MKSILIISRYFAPMNKVASIRPTKISKYLKLSGRYRIIVLTDVITRAIQPGDGDSSDLQYVDELLYASPDVLSAIVNQIRNRRVGRRERARVQTCFSPSQDPVSSAAPGNEGPPSYRTRVREWILNLFILYEEHGYARRAYRTLQQRGLQDIDVVFSTYGPFSSHHIAAKIKRQNPGVRWVADFRDPPMTISEAPIFKKYNTHYLSVIRKAADLITGVSEGCFPEPLLPDKHMIVPNGFDDDDIPARQKVRHKNDKLTFAYCGALYGGERDLTPFFRAVRELNQMNGLDLDSIRVIYVGKEGREFSRQAASCGLLTMVEDRGFVPRDESLRIQQNADALLLASWNRIGSTGVVTGKVYEQLMLKKPIICVVSGDLPESALKHMIVSARSGVCYEEANAATDYPVLRDFVEGIYLEHSEKGSLIVNQDSEYIATFHYLNIVNELVRIIEC